MNLRMSLGSGRLRPLRTLCLAAACGGLAACAAPAARDADSFDTAQTQNAGRNGADLLIVDCLLPSQVRKLGRQVTFLAPRRAVKSTASECEIRGGEYAAYDRADFRTAFQVWLPDAKAGDPVAQTYVGEIYEKGLGLPPDYAAAASWYRKAAAQGHSRAQINLGYLHETGLGVSRDLVAAMNYYRQASGLTEGDLEYVSSVEIAERAAATARSAEVEAEAAQLRLELDQSRTLLVQREQQLTASESRVANLRGEVDRERARLASAPRTPEVAAAPAASGAPSPSADSAELERQREALSTLNDELARAREASAELERELGGARSQLADRQTALERSMQALDVVKSELATLESAATSDAADKIERVRELEARLAARESEISSHRESIARLESNASVGRAELERRLAASAAVESSLSAELIRRNRDMAALEAQLAQARSENQAIRDASTQAASQSDAKLEALESELDRSTAELARQREALSTLKDELAQADVAAGPAAAPLPVEAVAEITAVGPTIDIIEPPLAPTRGLPSVSLRSKVPSVEIVGRVSPTDSLLTFRVNDRAASVDETGLFKVELAVGEEATPVNVVAIDRQGRRAVVDFMLLPLKSGDGAEVAQAPRAAVNPAMGVDFGRYHALIIGNDAYSKLPSLETAANDARAVDALLRNKYGFQTTLLENAGRYAILSAMNWMRERLTSEDNLLIYYAGHGELDEANRRGYWLPVDASPGNSANWISNVAVTDLLNAMAAKHILVVADSCYSGTMSHTSIARPETDMSAPNQTKWYRVMAKTPARIVLTSGGVSPVLDTGGGRHSVFAKAFLDVLRENDGVLDGYSLFRRIQQRVKRAVVPYRLDQEPRYSPIRHAGHEAGEFFLRPERLGLGAAPGDALGRSGLLASVSP